MDLVWIAQEGIYLAQLSSFQYRSRDLLRLLLPWRRHVNQYLVCWEYWSACWRGCERSRHKRQMLWTLLKVEMEEGRRQRLKLALASSTWFFFSWTSFPLRVNSNMNEWLYRIFIISCPPKSRSYGIVFQKSELIVWWLNGTDWRWRGQNSVVHSWDCYHRLQGEVIRLSWAAKGPLV